jgi:hypothetical protein
LYTVEKFAFGHLLFRRIVFIDPGHHNRTSYKQKFDMETIIFLKMY